MSYYASLINENKSDSKVLFNTIDRMLHRTPQNHYPSCGSPKELCDKFADFFCDKIVTIRHQLDTLSTTDAPAFPLIDDAIITCELSEFSPTSEDELSGLVKKSSPYRFLLILYLLLFYVIVSMIYYLLLKAS